jgi:hypothetical protein
LAKIFLGCAIIVVCTLIGKKSTAKFKLKLEYFECLHNFNKTLKQNLMHYQSDILNLVNFENFSNDFSTTLSSFKLSRLNDSSSLELYFPEWLDKDERVFLTNYFNILGKGNLQSEMENLTFYEEIINEKLFKIADKNSKFSKLGQKLGLAVGTTLFIIIL